MREITDEALANKLAVCEAYDRKLEAENNFLRLCMVALTREYLRMPLRAGARHRLQEVLSALEAQDQEKA